MDSGANTPIVRVSEEGPPQFNEAFLPAEHGTRPNLNLNIGPQASTASLVSINTSAPDIDPTSPVSATSGLAAAYDEPPRLPLTSRRSLDFERYGDSPRASRGGRELADEADRYAIAQGGRRPDIQRLRGESRAALLGRPGTRSDSPSNWSNAGSRAMSRATSDEGSKGQGR